MTCRGETGLLRYVLLWPVLFGFYLLLSGDAGTSELIAGCGVATAATLLVARLEAVAQRRFGLPADALRIMGAALADLMPETARVAGVLARALALRPTGAVGSIEEQSFLVSGLATRDAARQALETLGQALSPNGFAVAVGDGALRLHRLARR